MKKLFFSLIGVILLAASAGSQTENNPDNKCIVCSEEIDGENSFKISYTGIEYEFCSEKCLNEFKAEPILYLEKAICLPCGMDDAEESLFHNYNDTKYYFCNKNCLSKFKNDPEKYLIESVNEK